MGPAAAQVAYVDPNATGNNTGTNWGNAYTSLEYALSHRVPETIFCIAEGTYKPTVPLSSGDLRTATLLVEEGDRLWGAFKVGDPGGHEDRTGKARNTILDGNINPQDPTDGVFHVVTVLGANSGKLTELSGLRIRGGDATVLPGDLPAPGSAGGYDQALAEYGGGVLFQALQGALNTLLVKGCILEDNRGRQGGGLYARNGSLDVTADWVEPEGDLFHSDSIFRHNTALEDGGGIRTETVGYGSSVQGFHKDSHIFNTQFDANHAGEAGGACHLGTPWDMAPDTRQILCNDLVIDNTAPKGAGLYFEVSVPSDVSNCTIAFNASTIWGAGIALNGGAGILPDVAMTISNNIFWQNQVLGAQFAQEPDVFIPNPVGNNLPSVISHNDIKTASHIVYGTYCLEAVGNLFVNPQFVDAAHRDLRLLSASLCRDAGGTRSQVPMYPPKDWFDYDNQGPPGQHVPLDLDLLPRFVGTIDMGAYEYQ